MNTFVGFSGPSSHKGEDCKTKNSSELQQDLPETGLLSKVEWMDKYLSSYGNHCSGPEIRRVVNHVFAMNLDDISNNGDGSLLSKYTLEIMEGVRQSLKANSSSTALDAEIMRMKKADVMDAYLHFFGQATGPQIRKIINQIFGINLDGISALDKARISLYSKGQWILHKESDLFVVSTGTGDVDVKVYPTAYFTHHTGLNHLPLELQDALRLLGFDYNQDVAAFHYSNPAGETVPDSFKVRTMGAIRKIIENNYTNLP